jgi:hypothetical protein
MLLERDKKNKELQAQVRLSLTFSLFVDRCFFLWIRSTPPLSQLSLLFNCFLQIAALEQALQLRNSKLS